MPADFGDKELVWTLTSNGTTEKAYASPRSDYIIDNLVIQANFGAEGSVARVRVSRTTSRLDSPLRARPAELSVSGSR